MLNIAEVIISIILIILILLQERSSGLSGALGGGGAGASYQTRRGLEKGIFWATVLCGIVFVALAVLKLVTA